MMFVSKEKKFIEGIDVIYKDLTVAYLDSIKEVVSPEDLPEFQRSTYAISEGYRHCLCLALGLDSEPALGVVGKYESGFRDALAAVCRAHGLDGLSPSTRKGILEACVHCIEKSRKLVAG